VLAHAKLGRFLNHLIHVFQSLQQLQQQEISFDSIKSTQKRMIFQTIDVPDCGY
jgi:hypothetical protein